MTPPVRYTVGGHWLNSSPWAMRKQTNSRGYKQKLGVQNCSPTLSIVAI